MERLSDLLAELKSFRDNYSEEIPEGIIHGKARFKVQKNWFNNITSTMISALGLGILDPEIEKLYDQFEKYLSDSGIHHRNTTREDIETANTLLNSVIKYCEEQI